MSFSSVRNFALPKNSAIFGIRNRLLQRFNTKTRAGASLVSPGFDLLFVCGLAPWISGLVLYCIIGVPGTGLIGSTSQHWFTVLFVAASFIIGESHQFTSILRYYSAFRRRKRAYRWFRLPFWIIYAITVMAMILFFGTGAFPSNEIVSHFLIQPIQFVLALAALPLQQMILLFPVVLMQHFCAQVNAIGQMYCRLNGYNLSAYERFCFSLIAWLLVAAGGCSIAVPFGMAPGETLTTFANWINIIALTTIILFAAHVINRGFKFEEWMPAKAVLLWGNLAAFVLLPLPMMFYVWLFVPLFFHATQHWSVAWFVQQKEAEKAPSPANSNRDLKGDVWRLVFPVLTVTVLVLFAPLLWNLTFGDHTMLGSDGTLSVFLSMLVFYLHYFADRIVWRPQS